jgi:hypothetical protein
MRGCIPDEQLQRFNLKDVWSGVNGSETQKTLRSTFLHSLSQKM